MMTDDDLTGCIKFVVGCAIFGIFVIIFAFCMSAIFDSEPDKSQTTHTCTCQCCTKEN